MLPLLARFVPSLRDSNAVLAWIRKGGYVSRDTQKQKDLFGEPPTMEDAVALTVAFEGAAGAFILPPPEFDPAPGFPEARAINEAVRAALNAARPAKVVCLSTIGAQASDEGWPILTRDAKRYRTYFPDVALFGAQS